MSEVIKDTEMNGKTVKTKKEIPAWFALGIITIVAALCLAVVYLITKGPIEIQEREATDKTIKALMLQGDVVEKDFSKNEIALSTGDLDSLYECINDGTVIGYVGQKTVNGFGGKVQVTVGVAVDADGKAEKITGISVGGSDFSETAGLGAKSKGTTEAGGDPKVFVNQFAGKGTEQGLTARKASEEKTEYTVDAITAATITSRSVTNGVNDVVNAIKEYIVNSSNGGAVN